MDEPGQRVAIVTGAGAGLGAATARELVARGTHVVVNNRRHADRPCAASRIAEQIDRPAARAIADGHAVDAPGAADAIVAGAIAAFGRLDALVLNAGVNGPAVKVAAGDGELDSVMAINFFANAALVAAALPYLAASPAGRIVFVSSSAGLHGLRGRSAYAASKGALNAYALSLAAEQARGPVRVNVVAPFAATRMTQQGGIDADPQLDPAGPARAIAWFAGPDCRRNGEIWIAAGGSVRRAAAVEGHTGVFDPASLDRLNDLEHGRAFAHAEAAFADLHADLTSTPA